MSTKTVPARQAKNRFSELLDLVEHGEVVGISRHGRLVAAMAPLSALRPEMALGDQPEPKGRWQPPEWLTQVEPEPDAVWFDHSGDAEAETPDP